jgi:hypothetical protein
MSEREKALEAALLRWQSYGCPDCSGDCGSANPPVLCCIMQETRAALAMPATSRPSWEAGRDAAADVVMNLSSDEFDQGSWLALEAARDAIRSLTPPEDAP